MGQKQSSVRVQNRSLDQPHVDLVDPSNSSINNITATSNGFQTVTDEPFKRRLSMRSLRRSLHLPKKRNHSKLKNRVCSTTDDLPNNSTNNSNNTNNIPAPNLVPLPSKAANGYALVAQNEPNTSNSTGVAVSKSGDRFVMNRLRASFRASFRSKRKEHVPESLKPHQWQSDENKVKEGTCQFPVKYLGCIEVFDSRGMSVCEDALRRLRNSHKRPVKAVLYVTGDGLRVVEDETHGLIVDQTIEKVSFCAPDRSHERGFSYICRDGTTRRWLCHGFHASKDTGERLSHAVGCAFAVCLERKQKRDKEAINTSIQQTNNQNVATNNTTANGSSAIPSGPVINSNFVRNGSFRQTSLIDRIHDPQVAKTAEPAPFKPIHNPNARERPHPTASVLQRQGSLRGGPLNSISPFKRQLSLRLGVDGVPFQSRDRSQSLQTAALPPSTLALDSLKVAQVPNVTPILEVSPAVESNGNIPSLFDFNMKTSNAMTITNHSTESSVISDMCKELTNGLSMLSENHSNNNKSVSKPCSNNTSPKNEDILTSSILEDPFDSEWVSSLIFNPSDNEISPMSESSAQNVRTSDCISSKTSPFQSLSLEKDIAVGNCLPPVSTNPFVDSLSQNLSSQIDSHNSLLASTTLSTNPKPSQPQQMIPVFEMNCEVCNDFATGRHYGAMTCEGCKGFFRRAVINMHDKNKKAFAQNCLSRTHNCIMDKKLRKGPVCKSCRFTKCTLVGMSYKVKPKPVDPFEKIKPELTFQTEVMRFYHLEMANFIHKIGEVLASDAMYRQTSVISQWAMHEMRAITRSFVIQLVNNVTIVRQVIGQTTNLSDFGESIDYLMALAWVMNNIYYEPTEQLHMPFSASIYGNHPKIKQTLDTCKFCLFAAITNEHLVSAVTCKTNAVELNDEQSYLATKSNNMAEDFIIEIGDFQKEYYFRLSEKHSYMPVLLAGALALTLNKIDLKLAYEINSKTATMFESIHTNHTLQNAQLVKFQFADREKAEIMNSPANEYMRKLLTNLVVLAGDIKVDYPELSQMLGLRM